MASWTTTLAELIERHGSLESWLQRHQIDILALQEVKGSEAKLLESPSLYGAGPRDAPGFDCFFAFASRAKAGFNGVAVFARTGLTVRARSRPLGVAWLDDQGRCIETDHGHFVLLNIYAPNGGEFAANLGEKMSFFLHLQARIDALRAEKRRVVVVGDFNVKLRLEDAHASQRCMHVPSFLAAPAESDDPALVVRLRAKLQSDSDDGGLAALVRALANPVSRPQPKSEKLRVFLVDVRGAEVQINKGALWTHAMVKGAYHQFRTEQTEVPVCTNDPLVLDPASTPGLVLHGQSGGPAWISNARMTMRVGELAKAVSAVFGVEAPTTEDEYDAFAAWAQRRGLLSTNTSPCLAALPALLLQRRALVDVFALFFPRAQSRWTVFGQYTNDRYSNCGSKIDYILVDEALRDALVPPTRPLQGCTNHAACTIVACAATPDCALRAATANGLFRPSPFEGGGIPEAPAIAYEYQFRAPARETGIIYTPPSFSDHLAVTCLLRLPAGPALVLERDTATRACQPHTKQRTLDTFFAKAAASLSSSLPCDDAPVPLAKKPRSIQDYFRKPS